MDAEFVRSKIFLDFDFKNGPSSVSVFNEARTKLKFLKVEAPPKPSKKMGSLVKKITLAKIWACFSINLDFHLLIDFEQHF